MNQLTGAETLVANKLFATLDPTIRKIKKNFPYPVILSDTVGLIDKLPHDLVASFKSTLDEVRDADLLLKMVDISDPNSKRQIETTNNVITELGVEDTDSILVFNKVDQVSALETLEIKVQSNPGAICVSSKNGTGLDKLRNTIIASYEKKLSYLQIMIDYKHADLIPKIRKHVVIVKIDYEDNLIRLDLRMPLSGKDKVQDILKDANQTDRN